MSRSDYKPGDLLAHLGILSDTDSTVPRVIEIEIEDQCSSEIITRFRISADDMVALLGGSSIRVSGAKIGRLHLVGKTLHVHRRHFGNDMDGADAYVRLLRSYGWAEANAESRRNGWEVFARFWGDKPPAID